MSLFFYIQEISFVQKFTLSKTSIFCLMINPKKSERQTEMDKKNINEI